MTLLSSKSSKLRSSISKIISPLAEGKEIFTNSKAISSEITHETIIFTSGAAPQTVRSVNVAHIRTNALTLLTLRMR